MINFKEVLRGRKVVAYFKGDSKPEVDRAVQDYLKDYPFAGFMTEIEKEGDNLDGGYYAHLLRLGSCD